MGITVRDVYIGLPDAFNESVDYPDDFLKSIVMPPNFDFEGLISGGKHLIEGNKGIGKTALLLYLSSELYKRDESTITSFIYFKSDYTATKRNQIDMVSIKIARAMGIDDFSAGDERDFEYIWRWMILKQVVDDNEACSGALFVSDQHWRKFCTLVNSVKILNGTIKDIKVPKKITIDVRPDFTNQTIVPNLTLDLENTDSIKPYRLFEERVDEAAECAMLLTRTSAPYYILIDELEAFYAREDVLHRDLMLIRDLIFTTRWFNVLFKKAAAITKVICCVRTEILNSIDRFVPTKEMNKIVTGYRELIIWDHSNTNSINHPIFEIWLKRISMTAEKFNIHYQNNQEVFKKWFCARMGGTDIVNYVLNNTWCKPRDIVRFQKSMHNTLYAGEVQYTKAAFEACRVEYSMESYKELCEELNALYTREEIDTITRLLSGITPAFSFGELQERVRRYFADSFLDTRLRAVLEDLYRVGVIGNVTINKREYYQFQHRRFPRLLLDNDEWLIIVHRALWKHLGITGSVNLRDKKKLEVYRTNISSGNNVCIHSGNDIANGPLRNALVGNLVECQIIGEYAVYIRTTFEYDDQKLIGLIKVEEKQYIEDIIATQKGSTFTAKIILYDSGRRVFMLSTEDINANA